jgi:hypothetical protein
MKGVGSENLWGFLMPTITLNLPEILQQKLQACAARQERDVASVATELIARGLNEEAASVAAPLSHEEWLKEFDEWVNGHPKVDVVLDVSRESIYEGRGE